MKARKIKRLRRRLKRYLVVSTWTTAIPNGELSFVIPGADVFETVYGLNPKNAAFRYIKRKRFLDWLEHLDNTPMAVQSWHGKIRVYNPRTEKSKYYI